MKAAIDPRVHIEGLLREVPAGSLEKIRTDDRSEAETAPLGEIDAHVTDSGVLSLFHCRSGRIGWTIHHGD